MKYRFSWSAIHITVISNININIKIKMKVCSKTPLNKNPHHAEASQLTFVGSGDFLEWNFLFYILSLYICQYW